MYKTESKQQIPAKQAHANKKQIKKQIKKHKTKLQSKS